MSAWLRKAQRCRPMKWWAIYSCVVLLVGAYIIFDLLDVDGSQMTWRKHDMLVMATPETSTERLWRVDANTLGYTFTIDDPATWSAPWTAEAPMTKSVGPIFEHACHEGNYGVRNTLAGARREEKEAAEAATKKTSN